MKVYAQEIDQWLRDNLDSSITSFQYRMVSRQHFVLLNQSIVFTCRECQKNPFAKNESEEYIETRPFEIQKLIEQLSVCSQLTTLSIDLSPFLLDGYNITLDDEEEEVVIPLTSQYTIDVLFPSLSKFVRDTQTLKNLSLFWNESYGLRDIINILPYYQEAFDEFIESMKINESIIRWRFWNFHSFDSVEDLYKCKPSRIVLLQEPPYSTVETKELADTAPLHGLHNLDKVNKLDIGLAFFNPSNPIEARNHFYQSQYITSITILPKDFKSQEHFDTSSPDIFEMILSLPNLSRLKFNAFCRLDSPKYSTDQLVKIIEKNNLYKLSLLYCRFNFQRILDGMSKNTSISHFVYIEDCYYDEKFSELLKLSNLQKFGLSPSIYTRESVDVPRDEIKLLQSTPYVYIRPIKEWDNYHGLW